MVAGEGGKGVKRAVLYYYVPVDLTSIDKLGVGSTLAHARVCVYLKTFYCRFNYVCPVPHTRVCTIILLSAPSFSPFPLFFTYIYRYIVLSHSDQSARMYMRLLYTYVVYAHIILYRNA